MNKLNNCLNWLNNKYGDLKTISRLGTIYYVDNENIPLFYFHSDDKNGVVYISNDKIWSFLNLFLKFENYQIQDIIKEWLDSSYKINGLTPINRIEIKL